MLAGFAVVAIGLVSYFVARDTGLFAVQTIEIEGAPPSVAQQVRRALRGQIGESLLRLDRDAVRQRVLAVPTVATASLDRAFPHTLRIEVGPERPVAVVRQGAEAWLLSARGRVMAKLERGARPRLPRLWVPRGPTFAVGGTVASSLQEPLAAVAPLGSMRFPARVASVRVAQGELTLLLRSGIELRLGDAGDVRLKLAVAAKVLPLVADDTRYVDVSVPERPVAGSVSTSSAAQADATASEASTASAANRTLNSKVEVEGATSTTP